MPKVTDIAYGRLRSPDLDQQEEFLTHFGMVRTERTKDALYMRGTDPDHHIHVTELGDPKFVGLAYWARSEDDLKEFAKLDGASPVEEIDEPGGGKRVRLTDPNGFQIEVVHGIETLSPLPLDDRFDLNDSRRQNQRAGELCRLKRGPSRVKRIGHGVIGSSNFEGTLSWYRDMLGFIGSDDVYVGEKDHVVGSFNRCDVGDEFVDHHVFFLIRHQKTGLNHLSFEVQDIDDVCMGHEYLEELGKYKHMWGIGRHVLGSQVFDYWADPWGRVHEHWTDTDRLNAANGSNLISAEEGFASQWGPRAPQEFIDHIVP